MYITIIILLCALVVISLTLLIRSFSFRPQELENSIGQSSQNSMKLLGDMLSRNQKAVGALQNERLSQVTSSLGRMQQMVEYQLQTLRRENNIKLDEMRGVVDEKLAKSIDDRITQSFRIISERLEMVYKGLGEMQALAAGVGDLKKVLSNVKTRGILGELQLRNIMEEILTTDQYAENVMPDPSSRNAVEFAIKLPGSGNEPVYLPIDAKFPATPYQNLRDAYELGDSAAVNSAAKELTSRLCAEAQDISSKYIRPPYTTDFAIMFLPFEGLYAEAVNRGMTETLQRQYKVSLAGPSTMAAMLNALQMGFNTLAVQRRSAEVWNVLKSVQTEFDKFSEVLEAAQKKIAQANNELDKLVGTRTKAIQRKLRAVEQLEEEK